MPGGAWIGKKYILYLTFPDPRFGRCRCRLLMSNNFNSLLCIAYILSCYTSALARVCKVAKQNYGLSSLLWSHRGHWEEGKGLVADGSFTAVERFLQNEIYHFDVDVSIAPVGKVAKELRDGQRDSSQLIVAHPSALLAKIVTRQQLLDEKEGRYRTILLTIEPKFSLADHASLESLVRTVQNSSISQHVAVIVNSPEMLNLLLNTARSLSLQPVGHQHPSPLNIAVAFRSQPKSVHDFQWTQQVSVQQLRRRHRDEGVGGGRRSCRMAFQSHLPSDSVAVQVNMPDIALLRERPWAGGQLFKNCSSVSLSRSRALQTVPWLVDSAAQMWQMLELDYVDGFISNHPLMLLSILKKIGPAASNTASSRRLLLPDINGEPVSSWLDIYYLLHAVECSSGGARCQGGEGPAKDFKPIQYRQDHGNLFSFLNCCGISQKSEENAGNDLLYLGHLHIQ
eukprot:gene27372-36137_t